MTAFAETFAKSRRLFILRLLVQTGGQANESVIFSCAQQGGFAQSSRDDVREDLDRLKRVACVSEDWTRDGIEVETAKRVRVKCDLYRVEARAIELHASESYRFDVNGHGMHWWPAKVDSWTIGIGAGQSFPITPPEILGGPGND